jgi:ATP-dependent protease HslVU (ClpYQ) ATPase subunit
MKQLTPTYDEFSVQVVGSGNIHQIAMEYATTLHDSDPTYTYAVKFVSNVGIVVITEWTSVRHNNGIENAGISKALVMTLI